MSHDQTQGIPRLTSYDFELALEAAEATGEHKLGAFNKAEFAKNLAQFAPAVLAFAASMGAPIPPGAPAAVQFVIQAAQAIFAGGGTLPTA